MKIQTNISADLKERVQAALARGETEAGFFVTAIETELRRRKRGGEVVVIERKPGRPKTAGDE